jgi:hypothetical protein
VSKIRSTILERREHVERPGLGLGDPPLVIAQKGAEAQVLQDRQTTEDAPALRHLDDAFGDDAIRRQLLERFARQQDVAAAHRQNPGDRPQRRALAGAIGADQGHDLVLAEAERDAVQRADLAVVDLQVADLEQRHRRTRGRRARRRRHACAASHCLDALSVVPR